MIAAAPFRTKAAVKRAMSVGSRWVMDRPNSGDPRTFTGTIVRASTTSRWITWEDDEPGARPTWLPVGDSTGWVVEDHGFVEEVTGVRLRVVEAAPAAELAA